MYVSSESDSDPGAKSPKGNHCNSHFENFCDVREKTRPCVFFFSPIFFSFFLSHQKTNINTQTKKSPFKKTSFLRIHRVLPASLLSIAIFFSQAHINDVQNDLQEICCAPQQAHQSPSALGHPTRPSLTNVVVPKVFPLYLPLLLRRQPWLL